MSAPKVKAGTVIAGRYELVAPLSRGGMGSVWRAKHLALGSPIAVKLIDATLVEHSEARARFEREARSAAALRSPHVVQILDHGVDNDLPFMAMELLEGESLAMRLHRVRVLPPAQVVRVFQDVARREEGAREWHHSPRSEARQHLPREERRHGDREGARLRIAKAPEPFGPWAGGTRTGALIGTPAIHEPGADAGQTVAASSDLWSLGVIAFECVCGRLPFPSEKPGELILQICAHPMPIPSVIARVPPRFDAWFARACSREPTGRFGSAKELSDTLAEALGVAQSADVSGGYQAMVTGPIAVVPGVPAGVGAGVNMGAMPAPAVQAPVFGAPPPAGGALSPAGAVSPQLAPSPGAVFPAGGCLRRWHLRRVGYFGRWGVSGAGTFAGWGGAGAVGDVVACSGGSGRPGGDASGGAGARGAVAPRHRGSHAHGCSRGRDDERGRRHGQRSCDVPLSGSAAPAAGGDRDRGDGGGGRGRGLFSGFPGDEQTGSPVPDTGGAGPATRPVEPPGSAPTGTATATSTEEPVGSTGAPVAPPSASRLRGERFLGSRAGAGGTSTRTATKSAPSVRGPRLPRSRRLRPRPIRASGSEALLPVLGRTTRMRARGGKGRARGRTMG
ncbi:MAG: serine/threonine-protein kinase [Polyangiaceae bacterium]